MVYEGLCVAYEWLCLILGNDHTITLFIACRLNFLGEKHGGVPEALEHSAAQYAEQLIIPLTQEPAEQSDNFLYRIFCLGMSLDLNAASR